MARTWPEHGQNSQNAARTHGQNNMLTPPEHHHMARTWPERSQNIARTWPEHHHMARTWPEHHHMARTWPERSQNMARTWPEHSQNMARMASWREHIWPEHGQNMPEHSQNIARTQVFTPLNNFLNAPLASCCNVSHRACPPPARAACHCSLQRQRPVTVVCPQVAPSGRPGSTAACRVCCGSCKKCCETEWRDQLCCCSMNMLTCFCFDR